MGCGTSKVPITPVTRSPAAQQDRSSRRVSSGVVVDEAAIAKQTSSDARQVAVAATGSVTAAVSGAGQQGADARPSVTDATKVAVRRAAATASGSAVAGDFDALPLLETESEALAVAVERSGGESETGGKLRVPSDKSSVSLERASGGGLAASGASQAANSAGETGPSPVSNKQMLKAASSFWQLNAAPAAGSDKTRTAAEASSPGGKPTGGSWSEVAPADDWVAEALAAKAAALGADDGGSGGRAVGRQNKKRRGSVLPETIDGGHDGAPMPEGPGGGIGDHTTSSRAGGDSAEARGGMHSARSDRDAAEPSPGPKTAAESAVILASLSKSFLFRGLGRAEQRAIADAMEATMVSAGTTITEQGSAAASFFVIESGIVGLSVNGTPAARIGAGGHFSELQLMFQTPAQATVVSLTPCRLWTVTRRRFRRVLAAAADKTKQENKAFLRRVPLLDGVEDALLANLADALQTVEFESGHAIVREGASGSVFYIVRSGECTVTRSSRPVRDATGGGESDESDEIEVMRLLEGQFFGEQALLHDKPRGATVRTATPTTVLALSKHDFERIFGPADALAAVMEKTHSQRQEMEIAARNRSRATMKHSRHHHAGHKTHDLTADGLGALEVEEEDDDEDSDAEEGRPAGAATTSTHGAPGAGTGSGSELKAKGSRLDMLPVGVGSEADAAVKAAVMAKGKMAAASRSAAMLAEGSGASHSEQATAAALAAAASTASAKPAVRTIPSAAQMTANSGKPADGSAKAVTASSAAVEIGEDMTPTTKAAVAASGRAVGGLPATESFRSRRPDIRLESLQVRAVLGEGAFGRVMLVQDPGSSEVFALKQMSKARIVKTGQKKNVLNEKSVMMRLEHPHAIRLIKTFQDKECLYVLVEFAQGGDLFGLLGRVGGTLNGKIARYYAAVVASVFAYMHGMSIVYRDLKPENLCLMSNGMLKVVDFGFAKYVAPGDRTYTLCGTPEYLAPELISGVGHREGADWWALGILVYEMLHGYSPFSDPDSSDHRVIYRNILRGKLAWHESLRGESAARSLVKKLLEANPARRYGSLRSGAKDVMTHRFFSGVDWKAVEAGTTRPPLRPKIKSQLDVSAFDEVEVKRTRIEPYVPDGTNWDASF